MNRRTFIAVLSLVALALTLTVVIIRRESGTGTAASHDDTVRVTFDDSDTHGRIDIRDDGPPLPAIFEPIAPLFDITTGGTATTGTVTVTFDNLAPDVDPARIVMLVEERPNLWQTLDTTVDLGTRTATAHWPHFSRGVLACINPTTDFGSWGWNNLRKRAKCAAPAVANVTETVEKSLLPLLGGTSKNVTCKPSGTDWTFTNSRLTGCAATRDTGGGWPAKIGNQYPYPMLVALPAGVSGPGALDLALDQNPAELIVTMGWSLTDRTVVPGGGEVPLRLDDKTAGKLTFDGHLDETTLALKALIIAATILSRGQAAELRAAARAEQKIFAEQLRAGIDKTGKPYYNSDFAQDTGWHSPAARKERLAAVGGTALMLWAYVDLTQCSILAGRELANTAYVDAVQKMLGKCWPAFASDATTALMKHATTQLVPTANLERITTIVGDVIDQIRDIPRLAAANAARKLKLSTANRIDPTRATLTATRTATAAPTPATDLTDGKHYAELTSIDPTGRRVTLDKVEIYWHQPESQQACIEDQGRTERCEQMPNDYYVRNRNTQLRTLPISNAATFTHIADRPGAVSVPTTLPAVHERLTSQRNRPYWELTVKNGQVIALDEVFTP
jgi:hypothetical protein